ncbi:uncharacterized protein LOC122090125 isoform X2 [Macadamia integrifolia]|uniref:uncharacterized protein LOC122090125 isoform X2 n=1 Tax=Macadamia integrifolia TaxID=60698 RepID=UPI001C4F5EC4|nr:uncharacterized protein LOC122090125 isoform X2 [Macadamia integrifolia]
MLQLSTRIERKKLLRLPWTRNCIVEGFGLLCARRRTRSARFLLSLQWGLNFAQSFGSLKKRFPILSKMPCFPLNTQTCIVIVWCALHNFIREEEIADKNFKEFGENWWNEEPEEIQDYVPPAHISISLAERRR